MTVTVELNERSHSAGCCAEALPVRLILLCQFRKSLVSQSHDDRSASRSSSASGCDARHIEPQTDKVVLIVAVRYQISRNLPKTSRLQNGYNVH